MVNFTLSPFDNLACKPLEDFQVSTKKNILFTFDYELFLGQRSGSVSRCCIEPTNQLIQVFEQYEIRHAIFFVDTTHLLRLKEIKNEAAQKDFSDIRSQLQTLVKKGHYVFPHLHPHWLDAVYLPEINQWNLKNDERYRFSRLTETERLQLFTQSVDLLNECILPVAPDYRIDGYRAGGWCIQPFKDFIPSFEKNAIQADFSVLRNAVNGSEKQYFDFSTAPQKEVYAFSSDPLKEEKDGAYTEYVISVLEISRRNQWLNKLLLKWLWRLNYRSIGDGVGAVSSGKKPVTGNQLTEMVSIELLTDVRLPLYLEHIRRTDYMHFISHPKMLSTYNISVFKKFLTTFTRQHSFETDFRKMKKTM